MANLVRRGVESELFGQPIGAWEPFQMMRDLFNWDPFREAMPSLRRMTAPAIFDVRFDVRETAESFELRADLPGIEERDLDVVLTGNRLTIKGKREAEEQRTGESWYVAERSYGSFQRSFALPEGIDSDHINAELKSGVLTVMLPKIAEQQARKISVKATAAGLAEKVKGVFAGKDDKGKA